MKKTLITFTTALLLSQHAAHAQNTTPKILPQTSPAPVTAAAAATPATQTTEQKIQHNAGIIYDCATDKPLTGWTNISISLDKVDGKLALFSVATMGNKQIKPIEVCNQGQVTQAMLELFKLTTQGKTVDWQSLSFRSKPNRKFEFRALTAADIKKLTAAQTRAAAKP